MNTNMTGFRWFSKIVHPCALEESSLSIERVNQLFKELHFYDYLDIRQILMPTFLLMISRQGMTYGCGWNSVSRCTCAQQDFFKFLSIHDYFINSIIYQ